MCVFPSVTQYIIWAFGNNWPHYHGPVNRGSGTVTFYPNAVASPIQAIKQQSAIDLPPQVVGLLPQKQAAKQVFKATLSQASQSTFTSQGQSAAFTALSAISDGGSGGLDLADSDSGVRQISMHMPNVTVPSDKVTSYVCSNFEVPSDRRYHVIRTHAMVSKFASIVQLLQGFVNYCRM